MQNSEAEGPVLGVQTVPLEPASAPNPNITAGCGSPLPRHSQHTAQRGPAACWKHSLRVRQETNRGRRPDEPQLSQKHILWCRGLVHRWKGKTMSGSLSEGSSTANSKLPKKQLLQIVCKRLLHWNSTWAVLNDKCWKEKSVQRETLVLPQEKALGGKER